MYVCVDMRVRLCVCRRAFVRVGVRVCFHVCVCIGIYLCVPMRVCVVSNPLSQYIGETGKELRKRITEHKTAVRKHDLLSAAFQHCNSACHEIYCTARQRSTVQ